jgi:hypothetical protein
VDNGADVDRSDRHVFNTRFREVPLTAFVVNEIIFAYDKEAEKRSFLCKKFLLQSGADPTIYATNDDTMDDYGDSALFRSIDDSVNGSVVSPPFPSRRPTCEC